MSSYCVSCGSNFSLFKKEHGCPNCGFSFCSKCLTHKVAVPKLNGSVASVCKACNDTLSSPEKKKLPENLPPVILEKKLEQLENPCRPPITVYTHTSRLGNLKRGLSSEDQAIVERLEKLRAEVKLLHSASAAPTPEEIESRLAKLKGIDVSMYKQPAFLHPKLQTGVDPMTALVQEASDEVRIDKRYDTVPAESVDTNDPDSLMEQAAREAKKEAEDALEALQRNKEISERLSRLRMQREGKTESTGDVNTSRGDDTEDDEDEELAAAKIIQKALDENVLEQRMEEAEVTGDEELPWCQLCNDDGAIRCLGCGGDIYCRTCWKQTHGPHDPEYRTHATVPYSAPKQAK